MTTYSKAAAAADFQQRSRTRVGVLAVGGLLDLNSRDDAKMMAGIRVGDVRQSRQVAAAGIDGVSRHRTDVGVLSGGHGCGRRVGPGLGEVEQVVAVGIAADEARRDALVVRDGDAGQRDVAGVGDGVGEDGRGARGQVGARRRIGVLAIRGFFDVDGGRRLQVGEVGREHARAHGADQIELPIHGGDGRVDFQLDGPHVFEVRSAASANRESAVKEDQDFTVGAAACVRKGNDRLRPVRGV